MAAGEGPVRLREGRAPEAARRVPARSAARAVRPAGLGRVQDTAGGGAAPRRVLRGRRPHLAQACRGRRARLPIRPSLEPRGRAPTRHARERLVRGPRPARGRMIEPVTFYFVRHGESEANAARLFAGRTDSPLTERGRQQAEAVADTLAGTKFDRIVATPLHRSLDTANVIAKRLGLPVEIEPDLIEIDVGDKTGAAWDEIAALPNWRDDGFVSWPNGETLDAVLARSLRALQRIARETPGGTVLVVGHGGVTRILVSHFLGILPRLDRSPARNTNLTVLVFDGVTGRLEKVAESSHIGETH
ncbi:MAG: histidine phosphatase family protein [Chloroflexi bacterium]|nr:MAG: histidine phosphatase family protein [Chloroflexota bacterium]TME87899.1 MAG: histidine phosphatase family protein [Chloroflexota bacterium]